MPRLTRQPMVALLAALAALLAPLGVTAAGSVAVAARQAVSGATQTTSQAPPGRVIAGRELRDTSARRAQTGGSAIERVAVAASERAGQGGSGHAPPVALAAVVLLVAATWWLRRGQVDTALVGRTTGIRSGRGPPALACA